MNGEGQSYNSLSRWTPHGRPGYIEGLEICRIDMLKELLENSSLHSALLLGW